MAKSTIPWNVNQITKAIANGTIKFDNAIQRNYVWDKAKASLFIDTTIRDCLTEPLVFVKTNEKHIVRGKEVFVYDCIDGKQRSTTLFKFLNDEFALSNLPSFTLSNGVEYDLNGKKFSELDEEIQDNIKSYGLTIFLLSELTDEEVADQMMRLNNGKSLTGVESARIKSRELDTIKELASHDVFTNYLTEKAINGYANEDIIIKFALLLSDQTELSNKNVREAYETFNFGESMQKSIVDTMDFVLEAIEDSTDDKKLIKRMTSKANLITILYVGHEYLVNGNSDVSEFADRLAEFFDGKNGATISEDYNDACTNGTMRSANVLTRNDEFYKYVMGK